MMLGCDGPGFPGNDGGVFYGYTTNSELVGMLMDKDASGNAVASVTREYDGHRQPRPVPG